MKNYIKYWWVCVLFFLLFSVMSCSTGGDNDISKSITSMRVVQSPVAGATVCLDQNDNRVCDPSEPKTTTDANGYFSLNIPDDAEGLLITQGGTLTLPNGAKADAMTLLAPPTAKNITPLTTLVALNPNLLPKIEALGESYDIDIAKSGGVDKEVLQLALGVEKIFYSAQGVTDNPLDFLVGVAKIMAETQEDTVDIDSLKDAVVAFTQEQNINELGEILSQQIDSIKNTFASLQEDVIEESQVIGNLNIYTSAFFVFDPNNVIIPVPNDVIWAESNYKVALPTDSQDPAMNVLYSAINNLQISGLSPNAPIAIPINTQEQLDLNSVAQNLMVMDLNKLQTGQQDFLVTQIDLAQDGNYLKIYPLTPLEPGHKYLVVLKSGIKTENGLELASSPTFEILKLEEPITSPELVALEPLRLAYTELFGMLAQNFNIQKQDILEIFTFTTAKKSLSLQDFGLVAAAIQDPGNSDTYLSQISGLDLTNPTSEFYQINGAVSLLKSYSQVNSTAFTSFDITTLQQPNPTPISVPYKIYNGNLYSNAVLIFQHGLGGQKEAAQTLSIKVNSIPIIAMDLPEHGERSTGDKSGANYLTGNLGQNRINLYQSYFDIGLFITLLREGKFDIDNDGTPDTPTFIYFSGQSMGAITGSVATSLHSDKLDKIILNVGAANFAALIDQATNALIKGLLDNLGLEKNNTQYFITLGILQLLLDPCDPVYLVQNTIKDKTMIQTSYKDTVVPNIANKILATKIGFDTYVEVTPSSADPIDYNQWFMFKGDGEKNWITHGILLGVHPENYPEAANYLDENNLQWAYDKVNEFIVNYIQ